MRNLILLILAIITLASCEEKSIINPILEDSAKVDLYIDDQFILSSNSPLSQMEETDSALGAYSYQLSFNGKLNDSNSLIIFVRIKDDLKTVYESSGFLRSEIIETCFSNAWFAADDAQINISESNGKYSGEFTSSGGCTANVSNHKVRIEFSNI